MSSKQESNWEAKAGASAWIALVIFNYLRENNIFDIKDTLDTNPNLLCLTGVFALTCLVGGGILNAVGLQKISKGS